MSIFQYKSDSKITAIRVTHLLFPICRYSIRFKFSQHALGVVMEFRTTFWCELFLVKNVLGCTVFSKKIALKYIGIHLMYST